MLGTIFIAGAIRLPKCFVYDQMWGWGGKNVSPLYEEGGVSPECGETYDEMSPW